MSDKINVKIYPVELFQGYKETISSFNQQELWFFSELKPIRLAKLS